MKLDGGRSWSVKMTHAFVISRQDPIIDLTWEGKPEISHSYFVNPDYTPHLFRRRRLRRFARLAEKVSVLRLVWRWL